MMMMMMIIVIIIVIVIVIMTVIITIIITITTSSRHDHHHIKIRPPYEQYVDGGKNINFIFLRGPNSPPPAPMNNMLIRVKHQLFS